MRKRWATAVVSLVGVLAVGLPTAAVGAGAVPALGTITVAPATNLHDADTVTATLDDWSGADSVELAQCAALVNVCRPIVTIPHPGAHATAAIQLDEYVDGPSGSVPPRVHCAFPACTVRATAIVGGTPVGSVEASVLFLRSTTAHLTADPATGLTDGDVVTVHASGLLPARTYDLYQCDSWGIPFETPCDNAHAVAVQGDANGNATTTFTVDETVGGSTHCSVSVLTCGLWLLSLPDPLDPFELDFTSIPLEFAARPLVVTPAFGLRSPQRVTVNGLAVDAGAPVELRECGPDASRVERCVGVWQGQASRDGSFVAHPRLMEQIPSSPSVTCGPPHCSVVLLVGGFETDRRPIAFAPKLALHAVQAVESQGTVEVVSSLSDASPVDVTVEVGLRPLSAHAGTDYEALPVPTTITIPAGRVRAPVHIRIVNDAQPEGRERFELVAGNPHGVIIGRLHSDRVATVTIVDDDA